MRERDVPREPEVELAGAGRHGDAEHAILDCTGRSTGGGKVEPGVAVFDAERLREAWCCSTRCGSRSATRGGTEQGSLPRPGDHLRSDKEALGLWIEQTERAKFWLR